MSKSFSKSRFNLFFREIQQKFGIISKNPSENFCRSSIVFFSFGDFSWFVFSIIFYGFLWGLLKVFLVELSKYFYWTLVNYGVWISKKKHPESQLTNNPIAVFSLKIKFAECSVEHISVKSKENGHVFNQELLEKVYKKLSENFSNFLRIPLKISQSIPLRVSSIFLRIHPIILSKIPPSCPRSFFVDD